MNESYLQFLSALKLMFTEFLFIYVYLNNNMIHFYLCL